MKHENNTLGRFPWKASKYLSLSLLFASQLSYATPASINFDGIVSSAINAPLTGGDWTFNLINNGVDSNFGSLTINNLGVSDLGPDEFLIATGDIGLPNVSDGLKLEATSDPDPFELNSLNIAKGLFGETGVTIRGYLNGIEVVSQSVTLVNSISTNPSQTVVFSANGWGILDQVRIENTSSNPDFDVEIDDLTVSASTLPSISVAASSSVSEGNSGTTNLTIAVTRSGNTSDASFVSYSTAGSGANPVTTADIVGATFPSGTFTFLPTETTKTITIPVQGDTGFEQDETLTVTLSAPIGATISSPTGTGTIINDDSPVLSISTSTASLIEGDSGSTNYSFTVTRTGDTSVSSTASYATSGSGANPTDATDFGGTFPTGLVSFGVGETSQTINIPVSGDNSVEPDEGFTVTLSSPTNAALGISSANGLITNDDAQPELAISAVTTSANEGDSGSVNYQIDVNRTVNTGVVSSVTITAAGSGANPADATDVGGSFPSTVLNFGIGDSVQSINLSVSGDLTHELDEQVTFTLSSPVSASITTGTLNFTIINDDIPNITNVSIPDVPMLTGDTVTATITVDDDGGDTHTNLTGTIAGIGLTNLTRINSTTYTAQFTVPSVFSGIAAGSDISVSVRLQNSLGINSNLYTTAISQSNDAIASGIARPIPVMPLPLLAILGLIIGMIVRRKL